MPESSLRKSRKSETLKSGNRIAKLVVLSLIIINMLILGVYIASAATAAGQFTVGNEAPNAPSFDFSTTGIQDNDITICPAGGGTNYDRTTNDTHMNASYTPALNWSEGTDPNTDVVRTKVCVSTSPLESTLISDADIALCNVASNWTNESAVSVPPFEFNTSVTLLAYNRTFGNGTTFYVALQSIDNGTNNLTSAKVFYTFYINNSIPSIPTLLNLSGATNTTHSKTPSLNWTNSTDANNGNGNSNCPLDTVTYDIYIGNDQSGDNQSVLRTGLSDSNYTYRATDKPLNWSTQEIDGYRNKTYYFRIRAYDGIEYSQPYDGGFILSDYLPDVTQVFLANNGTNYNNCNPASGGCTINPAAGLNSSLAVAVSFTDLDQDCTVDQGNFSIKFNLCYNRSVIFCNEIAFNQSYVLDNMARIGTSCNATFTVNMSNTNRSPEFFIIPNYYTFYVNVSSHAGQRNTTFDPQQNGTWYYNSLVNANYTDSVLLGGGTPTLGQWNSGTNEYNATNYGNVIFNLTWYSSNPTSTPNTWTLNGTDMYIDDDDAYTTETYPPSQLQKVNISGTEQYYNYSTGTEVCKSAKCDDSNTNETLPTHWHIYPPLGLPAGTYTNTITYTTYS